MAEDLLRLALQGGELLEPLRQWLKLLLQSSPRLAGLQALAEELGELMPLNVPDKKPDLCSYSSTPSGSAVVLTFRSILTLPCMVFCVGVVVSCCCNALY